MYGPGNESPAAVIVASAYRGPRAASRYPTPAVATADEVTVAPPVMTARGGRSFDCGRERTRRPPRPPAPGDRKAAAPATLSRADRRRPGFAPRPRPRQVAVAVEVARGAQGEAEQKEQDHPRQRQVDGGHGGERHRHQHRPHAPHPISARPPCSASRLSSQRAPSSCCFWLPSTSSVSPAMTLPKSRIGFNVIRSRCGGSRISG